MRTVAQFGAYLATSSDDGVQIHQYAPSRITAELPAGDLSLDVSTQYPWDGSVRVEVTAAPGGEAELALRIPSWAHGATVDGAPAEAGYARIRREFRAGDVIELELPFEASVVHPHPRVDAVRGSVALRLGPLVYALEQSDQPDGVVLDDLRVDAGAPIGVEFRDGLLGGVNVLTVPATADGGEITATAIPYFAWANRGVGPMRIWLPTA
jgi:DUF1680 family protein